jgi:hypothetical protein
MKDYGGITGFDLYVYCMEEDWVGGNIRIDFATGAISDKLDSVMLQPPGASYQAAANNDLYITGGTIGANRMPMAGLLPENKQYMWIAPGIGLQWMPLMHNTNIITSNVSSVVSITEDDISREKIYDAGVHCWMRWGSQGPGEGVAHYTKPFPMQCLNRKDILFVYNSIPAWPNNTINTNCDLTVKLQGSQDKGTNWVDIDYLLNSIDPIDTTSTAVNDNYMIRHVIEGGNFPEYDNFRLKFYVTDTGGVTEGVPEKYSFTHISLYPIERH